jgi:hypothetical protein
MASSSKPDDPNRWRLQDIHTPGIYGKFTRALAAGAFSEETLKRFVVEAARFFKEKANEVIEIQEARLTATTYTNATTVRKTNSNAHGPAMREILRQLVKDIIDDEETIMEKLAKLPMEGLMKLMSNEIFISVLSLNTLNLSNKKKHYKKLTNFYFDQRNF